METFIQDVRYGLRMLAKTPGFTLVAVLTLALGLGANTAMFSVADALALRPLAVEDPARIVRISNVKVTGAYDAASFSSLAEYEEFRGQCRSLNGIAACDRRGVLLREGNDAQRLIANVTSPNYFDVLRVKPLLGRVYTEAELRGPNAPHVVLFSYDFWKQHFNGDRQIVGKTVVANDLQCMVAGILPRDFRGTELILDPEVYVPLPTWNAMGRGREYADRSYREFELFGRLAPGASAGQAQTELAGIQKRLAQEFPQTDTDRRITVKLDRDAKSSEVKTITGVLFGVAALVLLIACANISNLLLARGESRRKETATRLALGAQRWRLVRQSLTESLLLTAIASLVAMLLAGWIIDLLPALMPPIDAPIGFDLRMDARVLAFAAAAALLAIFIAGLFPAFSAIQVPLTGAMKEQSASAGHGGRVRYALVVGEVAISAVLLIGAGLLVRTMIAVRGQDPGFDKNRKMLIITFQMGRDMKERPFYRQARQRLAGLAGVQGVAFAGRIPMWGSGGGANRVVWVPGIKTAPGDEGVHVGYTDVSPGYFSTIGTRIVRGRAIDEGDSETSAPVAVINQSAAAILWPGQDPVGRRFRMGGPQGKEIEVVGVAEDGRYNDLREKQHPYMFLPVFQDDYGAGVLLVGAMADPRAMVNSIRAELRSIDRNVLVLGAITMDEHMRYALYQDRLQMQLVGALGAIGLLLAAVGLYGVISYTVNRRTREIGVRMAVGAHPGNVFRLVLKQGLALAGAGVVLGMVAALALARVLAELLYGVSPRDPLTFAAVVGVLLMVALVACFVPARRATKVDPMVALRYE